MALFNETLQDREVKSLRWQVRRLRDALAQTAGALDNSAGLTQNQKSEAVAYAWTVYDETKPHGHNDGPQRLADHAGRGRRADAASGRLPRPE